MRSSSLLCEHGKLNIDLAAVWRHATGHTGAETCAIEAALERQLGSEVKYE